MLLGKAIHSGIFILYLSHVTAFGDADAWTDENVRRKRKISQFPTMFKLPKVIHQDEHKIPSALFFSEEQWLLSLLCLLCVVDCASALKKAFINKKASTSPRPPLHPL